MLNQTKFSLWLNLTEEMKNKINFHKLYKLNFFKYFMARGRRFKRNKQRSMYKRMIGSKKPMSAEQKKIRKKLREVQREETEKRLAKK